MIELINGQIFIDGKSTTNPELIGLAFLDFAETIADDNYSIVMKENDVFIEKCNC